MDDVGNVLTKSINASEYSYQYDTAYQLTQANQPTPLQNRTFQYDAVGNRSASDETANWNYNANHQLLSYGEPASSTSLDYDANGSTVTKTITNASGSDTDEYSYDIANRLTEVKRNGTSLARYYYDPFGCRLSKEVSGIKTYFLYANEGLVGEYNNSGVLINSYMYQPDSMWGTQPLGMMTGGESYFYQHDQLRSPNLVTSNTGQIKWQGAMDAFGQVQTTTSDITNPLRFPGQYFDEESGLHYNYFRDYDPELGRYIQSDPIGLAGGINTYAYVGGNPVNASDPLGLWSTKAHNYLISKAFNCLSESQRNAIMRGSAYADSMSAGHQDPENAFMHMMTAEGLSRAESLKKFRAYFKGKMGKYNSYLSQSKQWAAKGDRARAAVAMDNAMFNLGMAMHPLMDSTSPAHKNLRFWELGQWADHGPWPWSKEHMDDITPALEKQTIGIMQNAMSKYGSGGECGSCGG
jgi:RHS repeat-associated protein